MIDEPKRLANLARHGIDQNDVEAGFDLDAALVLPTYPTPRTGRPRRMALGPLNGRLVVVIYSPLGSEAIGLVSVRPASDRERSLHDRR